MSAILATTAAAVIAAVLAVVVASTARRHRPAFRRAATECRASFAPWNDGEAYGDAHLF